MKPSYVKKTKSKLVKHRTTRTFWVANNKLLTSMCNLFEHDQFIEKNYTKTIKGRWYQRLTGYCKRCGTRVKLVRVEV